MTGRRWTRRVSCIARRLLLLLLLSALVLGGMCAPVGSTIAGVANVRPDSPAPCTAGPPTDAFRGYCATYGNANTFYGAYGLGSPTATGWGLCAWAPATGDRRPATGDWYPVPADDYVVVDQPWGISTTYLGPLGFAFSLGSLDRFWGNTLAWSADDAAVAAKHYYDALAWHVPLPATSGGVANALTALILTTVNAVSATGAPRLTASLPGDATSFTHSTTVTVRLAFPGSDRCRRRRAGARDALRLQVRRGGTRPGHPGCELRPPRRRKLPDRLHPTGPTRIDDRPSW